MTAAPDQTWARGAYVISTDRSRLDIDTIHSFLADSYWSPGIPREVVERAVANSLNFGVYCGNQLVGFGRVISDFATFAYIADVFVVSGHRGKGLSKWLMECIMSHPDLQGLRRWMLMTADAHGLYSQSGFTPMKNPQNAMEKWNPENYQRRQPGSPQS
jgi:N-acetylglutamate synthase-like GNAT family acetyltransferase